jgi:L-lactate dehydrogenase (cytochrome)
VHPPSLIENELDPSDHIGVLDQSTVTEEWKMPQTISPTIGIQDKPSLDEILNLNDLEEIASRTLTKKAWAYIYGASNDNLTRNANKAVLQRIWFRPAVMRNVGVVNTRTTLLGCPLNLPIFIAPAGAARTAGPDGELALARAAAATGIIHCISTVASYPLQEILDATPERAFFQLYVNRDRQKTEAIVRQVTESGNIKAIFVTADLPVVSKREADERVKPDGASISSSSSNSGGGRDKKGAGLARRTGSFIDPTFNWDDLAWLRGITHLPILIKGIQRAEDARIAMQLGCQGIVVSNHGGRAADTAPAAILTLLELHKTCPEVFGAMDILIDGGFRRGSDVVKAICLGASAVGLGRPFMYAVNYGQEGAEHVVNSKLSLAALSIGLSLMGDEPVLKEEVETAMRLIGMTDLMRDSGPEYLNTAEVDYLVSSRQHPYVRKVTKYKSRL